MTHSIALPLPFGIRLHAPLPAALGDMLAAGRQRRALARLDLARLDDLGITPEQARIEANRPFWDVPDHWRC